MTLTLQLRRELTTPLNFTNPNLELTSVGYVHHAVVSNGTRTITARAPLTWTVSYSGYWPSRLANVFESRVHGEAVQHPTGTERPGDDAVVQSVGLTGIGAFEEVAKVREKAPALATF